MKTYAPETTKLLNDSLSVPVFQSTVPENAELPAVAWYNIGYRNDRTTRKRTPLIVDQRVVIVSKVSEFSGIEDIIVELSNIDLTYNDDFQSIEVVMNNVEPFETGDESVRAMVDLKITAK